jgi:hypothetical protein
MQSSSASLGKYMVTALSLSPNCTTDGDNLHCHLLGFLHFLYAAASLLAVVLMIVIALAVRFYRRNKSNPRAGE